LAVIAVVAIFGARRIRNSLAEAQAVVAGTVTLAIGSDAAAATRPPTVESVEIVAVDLTVAAFVCADALSWD
jgi:hypothetical protein